jgi:hypothetical protein
VAWLTDSLSQLLYAYPFFLFNKGVVRDFILKYWYSFAVSALVSAGMFGFGIFAARILRTDQPPITVERLAPQQYSTPKSPNAQVLGAPVVASVNSDKYHYEWCSGAARISEKNKITFSSAQEAEAAGFTLAGNCKP